MSTEVKYYSHIDIKFSYGVVNAQGYKKVKSAIIGKLNKEKSAYESLEKTANQASEVDQSRALLGQLRSTPSTGRLVIDLAKQIDENANQAFEFDVPEEFITLKTCS